MASLGNDLASIRKEKELSLEDIHEATKIPKNILASIEDDSIFSGLDDNPTYIRSYVRGYAKALSIDEQNIIDALDKLENDSYQGSLQEYLDGEPLEPAEQPGESPEENEEEHPEEELTPPLEAENAPKEWPAEPEPPVKSPSVQSIDWADMGKRFQPLHSSTSRIWIVIIGIMVFAAAVFYFFFYKPDLPDQSMETQEQVQEQASDSLQLNIVPSENDTVEENQQDTLVQNTQAPAQTSTESLEALPDTLQMVVYAAYGKLEPVRVYTDIMNSINPYWIEQGNAMRFTFVNEMRIRGSISRLALLFNGHAIQNLRDNFYNSETGLLEITRTFFEGNQKWLSPASDSLAIDAPRPSQIQDRPIFN